MLAVLATASNVAASEPQHGIVPQHILAVRPNNIAFGDAIADREARALWDIWLKNPTSDVPLVEIAQIYIEQGHSEQAIPLLEEALRLHPEASDSRVVLATTLQKQPAADMARVFRLLRDAVSIDPQNDSAHLALGYAYQDMTNTAKAVESFKLALANTTNPQTMVSAHLGLASVYQVVGAPEQAQDSLASADRILPGIVDLLHDRENHNAVLNQTPGPVYVGPLREGDPSATHPALRERLSRINEQIRKIEGSP